MKYKKKIKQKCKKVQLILARVANFREMKFGTPRSSTGWGMGRGYPPPQPTSGSGERRELPSGVRGGGSKGLQLRTRPVSLGDPGHLYSPPP